jgi:hypothetical protein
MTTKLSLRIYEDGSEVMGQDLSYECVLGLIGRLDDVPENTALFSHLAKHSSSEVRTCVASKEQLDEVTVELLSQDTSIEVRRALIGQTVFREWASTQVLLEYIAADVECARIVAASVRDYSSADFNHLAAELCKHSDPDVRNTLAGGWGTPKKYVRQLLSDPDASIRVSAMRTLGG